MLRGIAEPICNSYTCAYLARVGHDIDPNSKEYLFVILDICMKHWTNAHTKTNNKNMQKEEYFDIFVPAIDWIFQCIGYGADKHTFKRMYGIYQDYPKRSTYLKSIIKYFPPEIIGNAVGALT